MLADAFAPGGDGPALDATPSPDAPDPEPGPPSELISGQDPGAAALRAIGQLRADLTCTATFIQTGGGPSAPAMLVTSGHCVQQWVNGTSGRDVIIDAAPNVDAEIVFNYFHDTPGSQIAVPIARIRYTTMKRRDLAILELDTTQGELAARGITPVAIGPALPATGAPIRIVGVPLLGSAAENFLRSARCTHQGTTSAVEFFWYWTALPRNFCSDIVSGSSGSPVLDEQGRAVAVVNTTTRGSPPDGACHLGVPCETRPTGAVRVADASYAVEATWLPRCFTAEGRLDLALAGCQLDDGRQLEVDDHPWARARPTDVVSGAPVPWGVHLVEQSGFTHVRYKIGPATTTDCHALDGYTAPEPVAAQPVAARPLPTAEGPTLLCLLGGTGPAAGATWQAVENATVVVTTIDTTPPLRRPELLIQDLPDGRRVEPLFSPPELAGYEYFVDPTVTVDCQRDEFTWLRYRRFPFSVPETARVCIRGNDAVDNVGPAWTYDFPKS